MPEPQPHLALPSYYMNLAKTSLKRIPGLVFSVRLARAIAHRSKVAVMARTIGWGSATRARRRLVFEALSGQIVLAHHPQESYVVATSDQVIGRSLYANGLFDFQKFETACTLIRARSRLVPDAVLIDAGANVGSICIPAVKRGLVARAIAFELDPDNTRLLRINALLNAVDDRINIHNMAVGAVPGEVTVHHSAANFGDHRVGAKGGGSGVVVPMITLDSIADDLNLAHCILWMDIQGYEAFALQGARRFMEAGVPLISEFSRQELESTGSFDTFLSLLCASGYEVFYDLNATTPDAIPVSRAALQALSERLTQQGTFTDLLFLPMRVSGL